MHPFNPRLVAALAAVFLSQHGWSQLIPVSPAAAPKISAARWWNTEAPIKFTPGKVTIVHFWTFGCSNCRHNQPIYRDWVGKYRGTDVQIVGVHTPETPGERDPIQVNRYIKDHDIRYPVAFDLGGANWNRWQNRYWPSIYLVDRKGKVRYRWDGELRWDGRRGDQEVEAKVAELLRETR
jgi:thiol-disulfide isomerase/thioredoxin